MSDETAPVRINAGQVAGGHFRYYDFVMAAFCVVLVLSNVVGAAKVATLGGLTFGAGILFFPLSYVLGDVLTEIYGYARARRVIWAGFGATVFAAVMCWVIVVMPPAPGWGGQEVYEAAFGQVWRIVGASVASPSSFSVMMYWCFTGCSGTLMPAIAPTCRAHCPAQFTTFSQAISP